MRRRFSYLLFVTGLMLVVASVFMLSAGMPLSAQDEEPADPHGEPPTFLTEFYEAWVTSPHARFEDDAFRHWDEEEEQVIPESCARCHSTPGYLDFLGADGSEAGVVNAPAPLGTVVNCDACHNSATMELTSVTFPSGNEVTNLDDSSRCMVCHQGRSSGSTVMTAIADAGLAEEPNTVSEDLRFINIHYYAAAASLFGSEAAGGFEYEGNFYKGRNDHVLGLNTCASCHDPHTLQVQVNECATCHEGVESVEDTHNIRTPGSNVDYDGDGDMEEGVAGEIETLQEMLYAAMGAYSAEVVGTGILYDSHNYPYFFADTNGDGAADESEINYGNAYASWTPALLKAAYNYQVSLKDPGGFAHNPDYHIQLLYDSIADLNAQMSEGVDLSMANRDSYGHFNASAEAFRHWDEDGEVSASCTKCHTSEGLPFYMEHGTLISQEPSNSLECTTCHNSLSEFTLYMDEVVTFPSGAEVSFGEDSPNNLCIECHQGRESTVSVNAAIERAGVGNDEVSDVLSFRNIHYFAAGATLFGTEVKGAYEFDMKEYNGRNEHTRRFDECSDCHDPHTAEIRFEECSDCHEEVEAPEDVEMIRAHPDDKDRVDYNGNGDSDEPIKAEIDSLETELFSLIQTYAAETLESPIIYDSHSYPYWFVDANGNGEVDEGEATRDNRYVTWSPTLLRAAYNYQYVAKDPGGFAHNPDYLLQVLYDSIEAVGGEEAVANFTRPEVRDED